MGADFKMDKQGGKRGSRRTSRPMSEINVTPFVDVMLVLLIIFMVTAPLLTVGVPIDLPKTKATQLHGGEEPLTITINKNGKIFIQETRIEPDQIVPKLKAITKSGYNERIFVRGDTNTNYGLLMSVMGKINAAGYKRIALITDTETGG